MRLLLNSRLFPLFAILLLAGCAQMSNPTGGPKDDQPPQLLASTPPDQSLRFSATVVRFEFDEYLTLNDIQTELVISPPMKTRPDVRLKKKSVILTHKEPLRDSTTYTFNFGQAIGDLNENNRFKNFTYVVSTGNVLDSLSVFGTVSNARTGLPEEGVKVMLYDTDLDSLPLTTLPYYFGITDKQGAFAVNNMRNGTFKVFALREAATDYRYNSPEEEIGFPDALAAPRPLQDSTARPLALRLFSEMKALPNVKNTRSDSTGRMTVEMSAGLPKDYLVTPMADFPVFTEATDSLRIWLDTAPAKGTYRLAIARDTLAIDTLVMRLTESAPEIKVEAATSAKANGSDSLRLRCDRPVKEVNTELMLLLQDKDTLAFSPVIRPERPREILLETALTEGKSYKVILLPGAIRTQAQGENKDTLNVALNINAPEYYGKITFGINMMTPDQFAGIGLLEIVDPSGEVFFSASVMGSQTFVLPRVLPGRYTVRLTEDANENGKWDTGDYALKKQPERVFHLSESIEVRSDWEQSLLWELRTDK